MLNMDNQHVIQLVRKTSELQNKCSDYGQLNRIELKRQSEVLIC